MMGSIPDVKNHVYIDGIDITEIVIALAKKPFEDLSHDPAESR